MPGGDSTISLRLAQVDAVAVETDEHADDVRVTLVGGHKAQVQAKRTLRFDAVLRAAVAQWIAAAKSGLDPVRDRLVLATGAATGPVRELAEAFKRCKTDAPGVEEEQSPGAAHARLLLGRVLGGQDVVGAWRDLVAHCILDSSTS
ncbi:hypothetical protein J4573_39540 [Actinomadura barringtoniae]|uniref:Uncharacterized protein n=1 Tax=Actinomadura barringtoniae TaxID=1427535 RepID=A0A939PNC5_9ACTN|nr:hypothetical protein [Actinomadura barringtoniae]MBO2453243.1 hypothetical protein [Actinomadura barringtoniae]